MELREGSETYSRKRSRDFHALGSYQVATPTSIDLRCCQFVSPSTHCLHLTAKKEIMPKTLCAMRLALCHYGCNPLSNMASVTRLTATM